MKRFFCVSLILIMMLTVTPVGAEDFEFDIYDAFYSESFEEAVLMEVDEATVAAFEKRLTEAWDNMDDEVELYPDIKIPLGDIEELFAKVYYENPKYYYIARRFSGTVKGKGYIGKLIDIGYTEDSMEEVRKTWAELDKATDEILLNISDDMTDFEKIMTVHDYMDLHYTYDIEDMDQTMLIMLDKRGVCAAYAEAFQHLMNVLGIECTLVRSDEMAHIWNMVKVDGEWYHVDITWDDPVPDQFASVSHKYIFLSEKAITAMGHTGFTAPYYANSTIYDDARWHDDRGSIVTLNGIMYRVEGKNLIDESGNVIYKDLDGGDGRWNVSKTSYIADAVRAGLCEINGVLYFNTDGGIYSYKPQTKEIECIHEEYGIGGIFADKNMILYSAYDFNARTFVKKGEIRICDVRLGSICYEDGKAVVRLYNGCDEPLWIISRGDECRIEKIDSESVGTARLENAREQTVYIWKNSLEPIAEPFTTRK